MFIGEYSHSVDEKGRLAIPTKFRSHLKQGAVVTRGLDGSLVLYNADEWKKMAEKLAALPISKANTRAFARLMLAGAMDVKLDGQGRIILPEYLRTYGGIIRKAVIAGLYNRIEIWSEERWQAFKAKTEGNSNAIAEQLGELDL